MVKKIVGTGVLLVLALALQAGVKMYTLKSPDGKVKLEVTAGQGIAYSLFYDGRLLLKPSRIALHTDLPEADHWENIRITGTKQRHVSETVQAPFYRVKEFGIDCNELELRLNNGFFLSSSIDSACTVASILHPQCMAYSMACTSSGVPISSTAITCGPIERISMIIPSAFGHPSRISVRIPR